MDSQLTLVTVAAEVPPAYIISTDEQNSCTELRTAGTGELLARITRKDVLPDSIAFPNVNGNKEMRLAKWLKKSKLADGSSTFDVETEHGTFFLRAHPVHRLALYKEEDLETPVAYWQRINAAAPPTLVMQAGISLVSFSDFYRAVPLTALAGSWYRNGSIS
ncbi:hypothetical protein B0H14DRAFT_2635640 [Mycena olivaceomarginata]|nr:hypothetical protein B0H14DRAFT_2635640 [Mycena olivaceomarginata]